MKNLIIFLSFGALVIAGCANSGRVEALECAGAKKVVKTTVTYGATGGGAVSLQIHPPKVHMNRLEDEKQLEIHLVTIGPDNTYDTKLVTVYGGLAGPWIYGTGMKSGPGSKIVICLRDDVAAGEYKFSVAVDDIGILDPLVKVEN
jgi:hypothetical protein